MDDGQRQLARVLVLAQQVDLGEALAQRLAGEPDLELVGSVARRAHALGVAGSARIDLVLVEVGAGDGEALGLVRSLTALSQPPQVIVLGHAGDLVGVLDALRAGCRAWAPRTCSDEVLMTAVRAVLRGERWLPATQVGAVVGALMTWHDAEHPPEPRPDRQQSRWRPAEKDATADHVPYLDRRCLDLEN